MVSIPYRNNQNETLFGDVEEVIVKFPSLIGTIKTGESALKDVVKYLLFPSLIGTIKTLPFEESFQGNSLFPSLIGTIKTGFGACNSREKNGVSIPYRNNQNFVMFWGVLGQDPSFHPL